MQCTHHKDAPYGVFKGQLYCQDCWGKRHKGDVMKYVLVGLATLVAFGLAFANADEQEARLEFDVILSDIELKPQRVAFEGEHQANDLGPVLILPVPYCDGTAI